MGDCQNKELRVRFDPSLKSRFLESRDADWKVTSRLVNMEALSLLGAYLNRDCRGYRG